MPNVSKEITPPTFRDLASKRLEILWRAVNGQRVPADVYAPFNVLMRFWGDITVPETPHWLSHIGNDHAPFEFSVAFVGGQPSIRLLVEGQSTTPGFPAMREACLAVQAGASENGANLDAFARIRDLFVPPLSDVPEARFALWHAAALASGPLFLKAYLNPQIHGVERAETVVQTALERLGLHGAWPRVRSIFPENRLSGSEIRYFAFDLVRPARARTKIYLYPAGATARDFERLAGLRPDHIPGEVTEFCRIMTGSTGPYEDHPLCVYLAFTGTDPVPSDVTIQVPLPAYVDDDRMARDRILKYFRMHDIPTVPYERVLAGMSERELDIGRGLHTYVSLRTGRKPKHVTAYFAAELYGVQPARRQFPPGMNRLLAV